MKNNYAFSNVVVK